eukprot:2573061-Rhodomonas_salina.1
MLSLVAAQARSGARWRRTIATSYSLAPFSLSLSFPPLSLAPFSRSLSFLSRSLPLYKGRMLPHICAPSPYPLEARPAGPPHACHVTTNRTLPNTAQREESMRRRGGKREREEEEAFAMSLGHQHLADASGRYPGPGVGIA